MTERQELLLECFIRCGYDEELALRAYNFVINQKLSTYFADKSTLVEGTITTSGVQPAEDYENRTEVQATDED